MSIGTRIITYDKCIERTKKCESAGVVGRVIRNRLVKKMCDMLVLLIVLINKIGYKTGQAGLLTYLEYIIWKGTETFIDIQWIRAGIKWNVHATSFYPARITNPIEKDTHNTKISQKEIIPSQEKDLQEIQQNIDRNDSL